MMTQQDINARAAKLYELAALMKKGESVMMALDMPEAFMMRFWALQEIANEMADAAEMYDSLVRPVITVEVTHESRR
jgi:hypothetical protein